MDFAATGWRCSFCAARGGRDRPLAGGLGAMICGECLTSLSEEMKDLRPGRRRPPWADMDDEQLLSHLPEIELIGDQVDLFLVSWVALARGRHLSWADIGNALGVSRQAVWERFHALMPTQDSPKAVG